MKRGKQHRSALFAAALGVALLSACNNSSFYNALGNKVTTVRLAISPASTTIPVNGAVTFTATGGVPPYTFLIVSGPGTINSSTGQYIASAAAGPVVVQVKDTQGATSNASITVTSTAGPLTLTPTSASVNVSGSLTFIATGGTPPYSFSLQSAGSGPPLPTVNATTGAYTTGGSVGADVVKVTDSTGLTSTSSVTVTTATTGVDNAVQSETLPTSGTGAAALPAGFSFVIKNVGPSNGTQQISWWVFLSPTTTPGSGTVLLASGTTSALATGASATIPLSWTWPTVPPVLPGPTKYLYIMISAADDLTTSNNTYAGTMGITVAPPDVNDTVTSVSSTGGLVAGTGLSGSFTLSNAGAANGSQAVGWTAYVSTSSAATIDASCVVVDSGSTGPLVAGGSQTVPFAGIWPATTGTYYLKVAVSAADDVSTTNNVQVSVSYVTTAVDYTIAAVGSTGGTVAGGAASGSFTLQNAGSANGGQAVSWTVYVSTTSILGTGSTVISSGSTSPLASGVSTPITFSGTWQASPGTYYLIAAVSAADDVNAANNSLASAGVSITAANVDYAVTAVTCTGGTPVPASPVTGSFKLANNGPNNGTQYVTWQAYASLNNVLDGPDVLVASGTNAPLAAGAPAVTIMFSGQWPLSYGNYQLIVKVTVPVDVDVSTANNVGVTASATAVGFFNEDTFEPNDNPNLSDAYNLGVTFQPGMSICITGSMPVSDVYDIMGFNTGTASSLSFSWSWTTTTAVNLYIVSAPNTALTGVTTTSGKTLSFFWSVDLSNTNRWVALNAPSAPYPGAQTLIITAQ